MTTDEAAEILARFAGEAYRAIAVAHEAGIEFESLGVQLTALAASPLHSACVAAMATDPGLLPLQPDASDMKAFLVLLSGEGSAIDLDKLPLALVNLAAEALVFSGEALTLDSLQAAAIIELQRLRDGLVKGRLDVLRLTGYRGIPFAAGQRVDTPWGQLRSLDVPRWAVPLALLGSDSANVATAMLVSRTEEELLVGRAVEAPRPEYKRLLADLERRQRIASELVPLALGLATAGEDPVRAIMVWDTALVPWTRVRGWSRPMAPRNYWRRSRPLSEHDLDEIARWAELVQAHYEEGLAFSGRRIVSALTARGGLEDVLIWKSLMLLWFVKLPGRVRCWRPGRGRPRGRRSA
jgi:hypothetical protein